MKTVAQKLLIKEGAHVWLSDPALVFADDAAGLRAVLDRHGDDLHGPSAVWIAYPKGGRSDVNRDTLRFRALEPGESFTGGR